MKQLTPRWIALATITAITLYVTWLVFEPFINVVLWSIVLTVIASPVHKRVGRWVPSPNAAALVTLVLVLLVVVLPVFFIGQAVAGKSDEAVDTFQTALAKLTNPEAAHIKWLSRYFDTAELVKPASIREQVTNLLKFLAPYSANIVGYTFLILGQFLLVLFTTYYMLRDGGKLLLSVRDKLPLKKEQADLIFQNVRTIISASLSGTVLIAAIQGLLGGIAFWVLGLPTAVLWGVVMFFMSMVPVVGSSVIWAPAAIYLALSGSWIKALFLVVWGIGVISMVDNILRPILVGSKTRMHELTVFFSVLGGLKLFGPVGIIMGPIMIAVSVGLLRVFEQTNAEEVVPSASAQVAPGQRAEARPAATPEGSLPANPRPTDPAGT